MDERLCPLNLRRVRCVHTAGCIAPGPVTLICRLSYDISPLHCGRGCQDFLCWTLIVVYQHVKSCRLRTCCWSTKMASATGQAQVQDDSSVLLVCTTVKSYMSCSLVMPGCINTTRLHHSSLPCTRTLTGTGVVYAPPPGCPDEDTAVPRPESYPGGAHKACQQPRGSTATRPFLAASIHHSRAESKILQIQRHPHWVTAVATPSCCLLLCSAFCRLQAQQPCSAAGGSLSSCTASRKRCSQVLQPLSHRPLQTSLPPHHRARPRPALAPPSPSPFLTLGQPRALLHRAILHHAMLHRSIHHLPRHQGTPRGSRGVVTSCLTQTERHRPTATTCPHIPVPHPRTSHVLPHASYAHRARCIAKCTLQHPTPSTITPGAPQRTAV